jgi:hypothetical protein
VFPIIKGEYFPGLYTAGGHLIMSVLLIYLLVDESRRLRTTKHRADGATVSPCARPVGVSKRQQD